MEWLLIYICGAAFSLLLTPLVIRLARKRNLVDHPGPRKVHRSPVPRLGGLAIAGAALCVAVPFALGGSAIWGEVVKAGTPVAALVACSLGVFAVGLVDDLRPVPARIKLLGQVAGALACCAVGIRIDTLDLGGAIHLPLGPLSWPVTVLWIVGITNAVNLIDGLDGLAAGIAAVACGVIAIFCAHSGQCVLAALMLAVLGSLTGFLLFNAHPARIFMGDSGTYFLGFLLGAGSVMSARASGSAVGLALPMLALGLPVLDTLSTIVRRLLQRRSIFAPDGDHIHHRLLKMGLAHPRAVLVLHGITVAAAALASLMIPASEAQAVAVFLCVLFLLVAALRTIGSVRVRDSLAAIRRNLGIARQARRDQRGFEAARLRLGEAQSFEDWWRGVCEAAEGLGMHRLWLWLTDRRGWQRVLVWSAPQRPVADDTALRINVPIRDRRAGATLQGCVEIAVNDGSLESAGRKAWLFGRLMDEHGLVNLPRSPVDAGRAWSGLPASDEGVAEQAFQARASSGA